MNVPRNAIVIPAYNEGRTIRRLAEAALRQSDQVIIVDDGSTDDTAAALDGLPIILLRNEPNQGKGASLWRGMQRALEAGAETIVTLDGDGQHDPADIPRLLEAAAQHPGAVIIAARMRNLEAAPRARLFANRFADFWVSWAAGQPIRDTQSGFRLYPARLLREVAIPLGKERGFVFESEILIEAGRRGFHCLAIPIASLYPHDARPSHFRPVADITRIVLMVAWKLLSRGLYPQGLIRALRKPHALPESSSHNGQPHG